MWPQYQVKNPNIETNTLYVCMYMNAWRKRLRSRLLVEEEGVSGA